MKRFALLFWFCFSLIPVLNAAPIDPSTAKFEVKEREKFRVDVFDFSGEYPQLENIDIDARRKKRVEMLLTGDYPILEKINYEGSFGSLIGKLTGSFANLTTVNFLCSSSAMQLDLTGNWQKDCEINIQGSTGNIVITLPKNVGLTVHTKTGPTGKVINNLELTKKGWGWMQKTYINDISNFEKDPENKESETDPVQIVINIEVTKAKIHLN